MKVCPKCEASNVNSSEFCTECAASLTDVPAVGSIAPNPPPPTRRIKFLGRKKLDAGARDDPRALLSADTMKFGDAPGPAQRKRADVMFLLDFTESTGRESDAIREAITSFADALRGDGLAVRVGLIKFCDHAIGER